MFLMNRICLSFHFLLSMLRKFYLEHFGCNSELFPLVKFNILMIEVIRVKFIRKIKWILCILILLATGCAHHPQLSDEDAVAIPSDYTYIIGPGDSVNIFVWGNPDISTTATVRPDGKITIPLAEDLLASGKTPSQLARVMEKS